jgi:hyaluronan synthase
MLFFIIDTSLLFVSSTFWNINFAVFQWSFMQKKIWLAELWAYAIILYTFGLFGYRLYAIATAGRSGWLTSWLKINNHLYNS